MLNQHWRQCKSWLPFTTTRIMICKCLIVLYQFRPTFVYINLPMQISIPSQREIKIFLKKSARCRWWFICRYQLAHAQPLLLKLLIQNQQTYAILILEMMIANYCPTRSDNPCQLVLKSNGIYNERQLDSRLDKTRPAALKIVSCFF